MHHGRLWKQRIKNMQLLKIYATVIHQLEEATEEENSAKRGKTDRKAGEESKAV